MKERFHFKYNSDCRGSGIFIPVVEGKELTTPQMPLNMPTYDEMLGKNGVTNENYNERLLATVQEDSYNMLTIHAEAEGRRLMKMFDEFSYDGESSVGLHSPRRAICCPRIRRPCRAPPL